MTTPPPDDSVHDAGAVTSRDVARGIGTTLLARLGALVEVVAQPLYVLMFGLAGYGLYATVWAAINLAQNGLSLGMTNALQRTVPRARHGVERATALRTALIAGTLPCMLLAVVASVGAEWIAPWINAAAGDAHAVARIVGRFAWALPLLALLEIATAALRARMLFGQEIRLRVMWEQVIRLALAALFFALGYGVEGLVMAHILSLALTTAFALRLIARHYGDGDGDARAWWRAPWDPMTARQTMGAGLSVMPANIVGRLLGDGPVLVLNALLPGADGARAAGLFTIVRKVSSVVQLVRTAFTYVLAPLAAQAEAVDRVQVARIYAYAVRLILLVVVPLAAVMAAGARPLLALFGPLAALAIPALIILLAARAVEAVAGIAQPVMQVIGAFRHQLTPALAGLIAAIALWWAVRPWFDPLTGVTLATAAGFAVVTLVPMVQLFTIERLSPADGQLARAVAVALISALIGAAIMTFASRLPVPVALAAMIMIALIAVRSALRHGLGSADRASLGRLGRFLRL